MEDERHLPQFRWRRDRYPLSVGRPLSITAVFSRTKAVFFTYMDHDTRWRYTIRRVIAWSVVTGFELWLILNYPPVESGWINNRDKHILCGIYGNRFVEYVTSHRLDDNDRTPEVRATYLHDAMTKLWGDGSSGPDTLGPSTPFRRGGVRQVY